MISRRAWALQDSAKRRLGGGARENRKEREWGEDTTQRQTEKSERERDKERKRQTATHREIKHLKQQT